MVKYPLPKIFLKPRPFLENKIRVSYVKKPIVLPEVSNSHRGGHPLLPPPSSLNKLKIKEEGEGGGATSFGEKVGDGGGSTAATSFLGFGFRV